MGFFKAKVTTMFLGKDVHYIRRTKWGRVREHVVVNASHKQELPSIKWAKEKAYKVTKGRGWAPGFKLQFIAFGDTTMNERCRLSTPVVFRVVGK